VSAETPGGPRRSDQAAEDPVLTADELNALIRECFEGAGLDQADASVVAEVLVDANLRGLDSHGFARVPAYMERVRSGLARGTEHMSVVAEHGALRRLDAGHALGQAAAVRATEDAIELAREHGCGLVAVGNSTHFGAAGYYARRAAERGFLCVVATNGPANMAPYGASQRFLGTNAFAIAAPLGERGIFVLDSSSSVVARGKIIRAKALGQTIEPGLAVDEDGHPTVDAAAALAGAVLPAAGPKGSGLAMAISIFATVLAAADLDDELAPMYGGLTPQNVGHLFLAVDPSWVSDVEVTATRLEALVDRLHALRPAGGFEAVQFPGETTAGRFEERLRSGIPVDAGELLAAASACADGGLTELAARLTAYASRSSAT
jgi:LDH2 family malate/lactate/ureidoglycolate dehydrogenase